MAKKKTTQQPKPAPSSTESDETPKMVRKPGDGSRMLSAEEVAELNEEARG